MRMFCLSPMDVTTDTIWEDMREHFERFARATGEISPDQVRHGAANSELQIWGFQDAEQVRAVAVTELSETPRGIICTIRVGCGDVPKALQQRLVEEIGKWARQLNCVKVRIAGRRGWLRRLPQFKPVAIVMEWTL